MPNLAAMCPVFLKKKKQVIKSKYFSALLLPILASTGIFMEYSSLFNVKHRKHTEKAHELKMFCPILFLVLNLFIFHT